MQTAGPSWGAPPRVLALERDQIHLWKADLDRAAAVLPLLERTLTPAEREKANKIRASLDRDRYLLSRSILRHILARYLAVPPGGIEFRYGPHGKPELAGGALRFNASHSQALAVYAITRSTTVGVDVERVRTGFNDVVDWFMPLSSIRFLEALSLRKRQLAFFQGWTRMEAYTKALGVGLTLDFGNFSSFLGTAGPRTFASRSTCSDQGFWWLQDFRPRHGYVGSLAIPHRKHQLRFWKWRPPIDHATTSER